MSGFIRVSSRFRPGVAKNSIRRVALVGADPETCGIASKLLDGRGLATLRFSTVSDLRKGFAAQETCLLLCEDVLPDGDFRDVLLVSHQVQPTVPVIVYSRIADWSEYLAAVKLGAHDLLRFPFRAGELQWVIDRALADGTMVSPDGSDDLDSR